MRNSYFLLMSLVLAMSCQNDFNDDLLCEETTNSQRIAMEQGIRYLDRIFYTKWNDGEKQSTRVSDGQSVLTRDFTVEAPSEGHYYLNAHILPVGLSESAGVDILPVDVYVNSEYAGSLDQTKIEWQFVSLKDGVRVPLNAGQNVISFRCSAPYYPEIDAVQIEKDFENLVFEDIQYDDYIKHLKNSHDQFPLKTKQSVIDEANRLQGTRTAISDAYTWEVTPIELENPEGSYDHMCSVPLTYTYYRKLSLTAGNYSFYTAPAADHPEDNVDPVMYLFKINDPVTYSFMNDDYGGGPHAKIIANNLPAGDYYLIVRSASSSFASTTSGRQGLVDIYQNNVKINENCPIAGYTVEFSRQASSYMNYFTAHTVGSAVFFLENSNTKTIRYMGSNETNLVGSDPIWGDEARLLVPSASGKFNMLVVAYGAFSAFWGNCDVYGNCQRFSDASILVAFPNLRSNDAIESAPPSHIYNCASWAGGLTYGWMWGNITPDCYTDHTILGYGDPYVWRTWDMYFGNEPARYVGATTYVRHNGSASNGDIAVWSTDGTFKGVTHFSISGASNNHPHGYAWESKLGPWYRIFHPMNALNSSGYGSIMCFYGNTSHIINSTRSNALELSEGISFEESVERGLTVVEDVQLSTSQMELLKNDTRGFTQLAEISRLYDLWEKRIMSPEFKIVSNPYVYIETQEALDLISYSKKNKRDALIFFAGLYFNDSKKTVAKEISYIMFCNIFTEYADIMEEIKAQWKKDPYDKDGAYKAPLPEFFTKKLVKSLMEKIL